MRDENWRFHEKCAYILLGIFLVLSCIVIQYFLLNPNNIFHTIFFFAIPLSLSPYNIAIYIDIVAFVLFIDDEKFTVLSFSKMVLLFQLMFFFFSSCSSVSSRACSVVCAREKNLCSLSNLHFLLKSCRFHNNKHAFTIHTLNRSLTYSFTHSPKQIKSRTSEKKNEYYASKCWNGAVITFQQRIEMTAFMHVENKFFYI